MYVYGKITDTKGNPVRGVVIETWETDGHGLYDNQVSISCYSRWVGFTDILIQVSES